MPVISQAPETGRRVHRPKEDFESHHALAWIILALIVSAALILWQLNAIIHGLSSLQVLLKSAEPLHQSFMRIALYTIHRIELFVHSL
ncbi:MAG: hypothetical protein OWS74_03400 [Firmicutes bacterium]|nr:hypothetical protein [Bacillota bacterium]